MVSGCTCYYRTTVTDRQYWHIKDNIIAHCNFIMLLFYVNYCNFICVLSDVIIKLWMNEWMNDCALLSCSLHLSCFTCITVSLYEQIKCRPIYVRPTEPEVSGSDFELESSHRRPQQSGSPQEDLRWTLFWLSEFSRPLHVDYVDLKSAFDSVDRLAL